MYCNLSPFRTHYWKTWIFSHFYAKHILEDNTPFSFKLNFTSENLKICIFLLKAVFKSALR